MTIITRAYKYLAFAPHDPADRAAFDLAQGLRRALWDRLIQIQQDYAQRKAALMASPAIDVARAAVDAAVKAGDKPAVRAARDELKRLRQQQAERVKPDLMALGKGRVEQVKAARQQVAEQGLHWGDYNDVIITFDGATKAATARGASVHTQQALADCCVNQLINGRKPAKLLSDKATRLRYLAHRGQPRKPGSRRSRYQTAELDLTLRGPRNPMGPARLRLELVLHRPLPANADIMMVRVQKDVRQIVNRDGVVRNQDRWSVIFSVRLPAPEQTYNRPAGLALTWTQPDDPDDLVSFAVLATPKGSRDLVLPYGHVDDWLILKERLATDPQDPAVQVEVDRARQRLHRRRRAAWRDLAAEIATAHDAVAIQTLDLSQKGVKNYAGLGDLTLALSHALEARGGTLIKVPVGRGTGTARTLAKTLLNAAQSHGQTAISPGRNDDKAEEIQCDAA